MDTLEAAESADQARWRVCPARSSLPVVRWTGLVALLLAEVIGLTLRFDGEALTGGWGAIGVALVRHARWIPPVGLTMALATLALGGTRLRDELGESLTKVERPHRWRLFLIGHLVAVGILTFVSALVMETDLRSSPRSDRLAIVWLAAAALTLTLWAASVLPATVWLAQARRSWRLLAAGTALGTTACVLGLLTDGLWRPLGRSTLLCVQLLLSLFFRETIVDPARAVVGTPSFWVEVAPECSGYEGIGLIVVSTTAYLWFYRCALRFPRAFLLIPLGIALIIVANILRIASLVAIGSWGSRDVALGGFHSQVGWLAFNVVALGLIGFAQSVRFIWKAPARPQAAPGSGATSAYLAPIVAIIATAMVTRAFSSGFDWLYPLRPLAVILVLWFRRRDYAELRWSWSWHAVAIGVAAFLLWMAMQPASTEGDPRSAIAAGLASLPGGWAAGWLAFRVVGAVLTVPLAEELAFRGYLARRLMAADFQDVPLGRFSWSSFLLSSALFGALHDDWLAGTLVGMLYAAALARRGCLMDAILAHAATNGLLAAYVLVTRDWSLWS
jgi:exosortase E/protease (VPEID-CTERM system)